MIEYLLARALAKLPEELRARYETEWRADRAVLGSRRLTSLRWAFGLQHAAAQLRAQQGIKRGAQVPRLALDACALGLAYYAAYRLRFGADVPARYQDLLMQSLPFAIVGGLVCMALTGNYSAASGGAIRIVKGVALATLALIAYAAVVQPTLVVSIDGLTVLNIPASVSVLFAMTATTTMLINRAVTQRGQAQPPGLSPTA